MFRARLCASGLATRCTLGRATMMTRTTTVAARAFVCSRYATMTAIGAGSGGALRMASSSSSAASPLTTSRACHATGGGDRDATTAATGLDFEYDPMAGVRHDAAVVAAGRDLDSILEELLPEGAPPAAAEKVRLYLQQHPVDSLITAANVQITHVESPETGLDERASLSPVPLVEALEQSEFRKMHLVQMGCREDVAFCRIRDERPWVYKLIAEEMSAVEAERAALEEQEQRVGNRRGGRGSGGLKELVDNNFRDLVDAHFIGWKSKKICEDVKKGHSVKLTIRDFQSAETAMHKLREMSNAMKRYAEEKAIWHHFTSIVGNEREASITFSPAVENKAGQISKLVKHPGEKEWAHALKRMQDSCQRSGRIGTYAKTGNLRPRNVGSTMYRTDKFGRRIN